VPARGGHTRALQAQSLVQRGLAVPGHDIGANFGLVKQEDLRA
jgi:hypothetical protein